MCLCGGAVRRSLEEAEQKFREPFSADIQSQAVPLQNKSSQLAGRLGPRPPTLGQHRLVTLSPIRANPSSSPLPPSNLSRPLAQRGGRGRGQLHGSETLAQLWALSSVILY